MQVVSVPSAAVVLGTQWAEAGVVQLGVVPARRIQHDIAHIGGYTCPQAACDLGCRAGIPRAGCMVRLPLNDRSCRHRYGILCSRLASLTIQSAPRGDIAARIQIASSGQANQGAGRTRPPGDHSKGRRIVPNLTLKIKLMPTS